MLRRDVWSGNRPLDCRAVVWRLEGEGVDGLPGVEGPDGDDADGDDGGGGAEDADVGLNLVDALDDLALLALAVGVDIGEEEAFLLVTGELAAIGEDGDETGSEDGPDGQHDRNCVD